MQHILGHINEQRKKTLLLEERVNTLLSGTNGSISSEFSSEYFSFPLCVDG